MKAICYLVVQAVERRLGMQDEEGRRPLEMGAVRVTKTRPRLARDEISVRLEADIPDSLFRRPTLEARIEIPPEGQLCPRITTDVASNIEQLVREQLGVVLHVDAPGVE